VRETAVTEVKIDESGRLVVVPRLASGEDFAFVYRAAMGVSWEQAQRGLVSSVPEGQSYLDWFHQIVAAVADEYGAHLVVTEVTRWNVSDQLRRDIEAWYRTRSDHV
jgi:Integron Cassette Protein Hfx_Cass5